MEEVQKKLAQYIPLQNEGQEANAATLASIEKAINDLDDPVYRQIMRLHYLEPDEELRYRPRRWRTVAVMVYGNSKPKTLTQIYRIHAKALREIAHKGSTKPVQNP